MVKNEKSFSGNPSDTPGWPRLERWCSGTRAFAMPGTLRAQCPMARSAHTSLLALVPAYLHGGARANWRFAAAAPSARAPRHATGLHRLRGISCGCRERVLGCTVLHAWSRQAHRGRLGAWLPRQCFGETRCRAAPPPRNSLRAAAPSAGARRKHRSRAIWWAATVALPALLLVMAICAAQVSLLVHGWAPFLTGP